MSCEVWSEITVSVREWAQVQEVLSQVTLVVQHSQQHFVLIPLRVTGAEDLVYLTLPILAATRHKPRAVLSHV